MKSGRRNVGIWNSGALWVMWMEAHQVFIGIIPVSELECLLPSFTAGYACLFSLEYFLAPLPRSSRFFNCLCKHWSVLESQALSSLWHSLLPPPHPLLSLSSSSQTLLMISLARLCWGLPKAHSTLILPWASDLWTRLFRSHCHLDT